MTAAGVPPKKTWAGVSNPAPLKTSVSIGIYGQRLRNGESQGSAFRDVVWFPRGGTLLQFDHLRHRGRWRGQSGHELGKAFRTHADQPVLHQYVFGGAHEIRTRPAAQTSSAMFSRQPRLCKLQYSITIRLPVAPPLPVLPPARLHCCRADRLFACTLALRRTPSLIRHDRASRLDRRRLSIDYPTSTRRKGLSAS